MPKNLLPKYPAPARKWAFIKVLDEGFTPHDTTHSPQCIQRMIYHAEQYQRAQQPLPGLAATPTRPDVSAPGRVPPAPDTAEARIFEAMAAVGTLRGLHLVAGSGGDWGLTVKLTLPSGKQVYRYGRLQHPNQLVSVISHWIANPRWIPDKQAPSAS